MDENSFGNRLYSYMFYAIAVVILIVSIFFYNIVLFALSAVLVFAAALYYSSGHIINNILLKRSLFMEVRNGYRLGFGISSAVKKAGTSYKSVSVAVLRLNRSVSVGSAEMLSLIEGISDPFEFSIGLREVNKRAMLEGLETKRRMREISLARLPQGAYDRANSIKREIDLFEKEIEGVQGRGKALDVSIRIRTVAVSHDEADASRSSFASLTHVADAFSTVLNASYSILKGEELLAEVG